MTGGKINPTKSVSSLNIASNLRKMIKSVFLKTGKAPGVLQQLHMHLQDKNTELKLTQVGHQPEK